MHRFAVALAVLLLSIAGQAQPDALAPCRLKGIEREVRCGVLKRPLDPAHPAGTQIDLHYAVVPAAARNRKREPVFFLAGGPGQSAMDLAAQAVALTSRLSNLRDLVLVDQRGTGRSAPLRCDEDDPALPLAEQLDPARQLRRLAACRQALRRLPHGDLRQFTTSIAMADLDAVREAIGTRRVNLIGGSYGTRAALEYMRLFPHAVRRVVIDGVAPPDMALPASMSFDNQRALDAVFESCEREPACAARHPKLRTRWGELLESLPRPVLLAHPLSGRPEQLVLTRHILLNALRSPLYSPMLSSALPQAIDEAAHGRLQMLLALSLSLAGREGPRLAAGMHFSVICAEDVPRMQKAGERVGGDFGALFGDLYLSVCADWPRGEPPAAFYTMPPATAATLVLSGGLDPVTPPRHGARVVQALGRSARHVEVANAGHGIASLGCMSDVLFRFINADSDEAALEVDAACVNGVPRPPAFAAPVPGARP
jgi:pimeloyl-ACP methyl ester carboxylesterase